MVLYRLIRSCFFCFSPEVAHQIALTFLKITPKCCWPKLSKKPRQLMGLHFDNPIGLAAGFDKNGDYIDALAKLGFGFIEVGAVTPLPQGGQAKPRLFRLKEHDALINRMGFNNKGVDYLVERLSRRKYRGILGVNIAKNLETPLQEARRDYLICLQKIYPFADFVTINISSPNTPQLQELQSEHYLADLLKELKQEQAKLAKQYQKYVPLLVKISPDLNKEEIISIANLLLQFEIDGVIAVNTSKSRMGVENSIHVNETGGLSGRPLRRQSNFVIRELHTILKNKIPIIGCGGIMSPQDAREKFEAGASLIQLYTGLIYEGPGLVKRIGNSTEKHSNS